MPTIIAQSPNNFFVVNQSTVNILIWDKVIKDVNQNYLNGSSPDNAKVVGYFVYRTPNPNGENWGSPYGYIGTLDPYNDADTFFMDFNVDGNYLYQVCPTIDGTVTGIGLCTQGGGIVSATEITVPVPTPQATPAPLIWDIGSWDINTWG